MKNSSTPSFCKFWFLLFFGQIHHVFSPNSIFEPSEATEVAQEYDAIPKIYFNTVERHYSSIEYWELCCATASSQQRDLYLVSSCCREHDSLCTVRNTMMGYLCSIVIHQRYRCSTTTCMVCSRRCTHSATSQPPTPLLTWSPSPSPSIPESPRRSRSVLSSVMNPNCNRMDPASMPTQRDLVEQGGKRRRKAVDDEELAVIPSSYNNNVQYMKDCMLLPLPSEAGVDQSPEEFGPGCDRLVCKKCCYEDVLTYVTIPLFWIQATFGFSTNSCI